MDMIYVIIGFGVGLYAVWWFMTMGGRYPLFYGPKWHDEQARQQKDAEEAQIKKEQKDRDDLAKKIAEELKNNSK